ncbi:hypothetical protein [Gloeocapsopsis sp. IPPAS B-1203]|nr:hypothetical protein [Gloeocapsopsis sp. IPPAS B-1203]
MKKAIMTTIHAYTSSQEVVTVTQVVDGELVKVMSWDNPTCCHP